MKFFLQFKIFRIFILSNFNKMEHLLILLYLFVNFWNISTKMNWKKK